MRLSRATVTTGLLAVAVLVSTSCISWKSGWKDLDIRETTGKTEPLLRQAETLVAQANNGDKVLGVIEAYEQVLEVEPRNLDALIQLASFHILAGAGYSESNTERKRHYRQALQMSERAMYTDPVFRERVDAGAETWEALDALGPDQSDALGFWSVALFYYHKEVLAGPSKLLNIKWIRRASEVLERIEAEDPTWNGGSNYFSLAIYYLALPKRFGRSLETSSDYFDKAIEAGPDWLHARWGRAKYYYVFVGNREGFLSDLEWVLAQDPRKAGGPYPWNVYFQNQAQILLDNADVIFKDGSRGVHTQ